MVAAGCGITLSLAPFNIWPLALVALMSLYYALNQSSIKQAIYLSFTFASAMFISGCYWVYVSMNTYGGAPPILASIMTATFCLFLASLVPPFAVAYVKYFNHTELQSPLNITYRHLQRALAFACLWMLSEWLRTWFLTGFPWLFAGYSQTDGPLHSWAPIIGTLGLSLLIGFSAALLLELIQLIPLKHKQQRASQSNTHNISAIITMLLILSSIWLLPLQLKNISWSENSDNNAINVALIQPNIDINKKWDPRYVNQDMQYFRRTSQQLTDSDIIIWPETAVAKTYRRAEYFLNKVDQEAKASDTAIILGIPSQWLKGDHYIYHNSMITIGQGEGMYHKQKLVPFGEYVPLEDWLRGLIEFFDLPMSQFRPGPDQQKAFIAKGLRVMPYICYEIVYPNFVAKTAADADLLLTVSNDAWFGDSIGPLQHLQMVQMRALETGRYILRGTNNGVTAVIDSQGKIIAKLPQFERGILKAKVYARQGLTPVAQYGTLPTLYFSLICLLLMLVLPKLGMINSNAKQTPV